MRKGTSETGPGGLTRVGTDQSGLTDAGLQLGSKRRLLLGVRSAGSVGWLASPTPRMAHPQPGTKLLDLSRESWVGRYRAAGSQMSFELSSLPAAPPNHLPDTTAPEPARLPDTSGSSDGTASTR
jgi:hypothetical protein